MSHVPAQQTRGRAAFNALPSPNSPPTSPGRYSRQHSRYMSDDLSVYEDDPWAGQRQYHTEAPYSHEGRYDDPARTLQSPPALYDQPASSEERLSGEYSQKFRPDVSAYYGTSQAHGPVLMNEKKPNWKPTALRWPFLTILLLVVLAFIGLLAYGFHALPMQDEGRLLPRSDFLRRAGSSTITGTTTNQASMPASTNFASVGNGGPTTVTEPSITPVTTSPIQPSTNFASVGDGGLTTITPVTTPSQVTSAPASTNFGSVGNGGLTTITPVTTPSQGTFTVASTNFGSAGNGGLTTITPVTTPSPIPSTIASTNFGSVGSGGQVTATTVNFLPETNFGSVGDGGTSTVVASNFGSVGTGGPTIVPTKTATDFGSVGSGGPTEVPTKVSTDFGSVGTGGPTVVVTQDSTQFGSVGGGGTTTLGFAPSSNFGSVGTGGQVTATVPASNFGSVGSDGLTSMALTNDRSDFGSATGGGTTITHTVPTSTPTLVTAVVTTLTNSAGVVTGTSTSTPSAISTPVTITTTDSKGQSTILTSSALASPSTTVLTDANGKPTSTQTQYPAWATGSATTTTVVVNAVSRGTYFVGMFVPTILAMALTIPIRILDINAKMYQPWHELTHPEGALGRESLLLRTNGWYTIVSSVKSLIGGQGLVFLTTLLVLSSAFLVPLASEAVTFRLVGPQCFVGSQKGSNCIYELSIFNEPAKATLGILCFMGLLTLIIIAFLMKWSSGVKSNPWSIAGIASLSLNPDVRQMFTSLPVGADAGKMSRELLLSVFGETTFGLGWFYNTNGGLEYGIVLREDRRASLAKSGNGIDYQALGDKYQGHRESRRRHHLPFLMLGYIGRSIFLFITCGLLAVILYYNNTGGDTPFENFMDSESFGVKFLFTGVGVLITFFWESFFTGMAIASPYQLMASKPQFARRSILLGSPTNAFSGLWSALRRRHVFLAIVALVSILSETLPIFLVNVPFRVTQTFFTNRFCTWAAVGILCIMVLVMVTSFFMSWPHMPVDPSTIGGAMYYVCDSWMLSHFDGLSTLKRRDRDWRLHELGLRYRFGPTSGVSGIERIGVDTVDGRTASL